MTTRTSAPAWYSPTFTYTLRGQTCIDCGVLFGLEAHYDDERKQDHKSFSCPNGHSQHYVGKTDVQIAHEERDAARQLAARESRRRQLAQADAEHARRSAAAYKGWATRVRNRIANGVCPCCNRSFTNVRRHMESQHPDYTIPEPTE